MPLIRANALRSLQSSLRYSGARATARAAPAGTQLVARRYASSGGHGGAHGEPSSDLPWILGALVVTPPSCWYLWPDTSHAEHHGDHAEHGEHEESEKPDESEQSKEDEEPQEEAAPAEQQGGEEKGDEEEKPAEEEKSGDGDEAKETSDGDDSGKDEDASKDSAEEKAGGKSGVEGVQFKGKMADDSAGQEHTRKLEDSPKGGQKKRLDSGLGKNLGEGPAYEGDREAQAQSKPTGDRAGDISQKQKGLSNTDTRHSVQIDAPGSEKSTKGSGGPETAKHKGTVDTAGALK
ncbi:hypothetical protein M409DRAFT_61471 [Zasmidium cellare ATCC 36951]|uniref:Uncharacterized protein n=1 Tax=Zasmidium cellare ATCC 36951 TaxID=1080233 RepID=A0A6A6BV54_ZASCE|nr:uncharacterized protein M409DRAFT_61471 [Zasmidium cellare ATCC 36951]KAF2158631.1 hypothetical protein M409DRAFT_61471 [Zasmidium cellare ATCC 36951]